jgi:hypothetical protein
MKKAVAAEPAPAATMMAKAIIQGRERTVDKLGAVVMTNP